MSSASGSFAMKSYSFITCSDEETLNYVESQARQVALLAEDLMVIQKAAKAVTITKSAKKDCKYTASTRVVCVTLEVESVSHEIHHAAQHASFRDPEVGAQVMGTSEFTTAMEISALASGIAAGSTYYTKGSDALARETQERFKAYDRIYGDVTCVASYGKLRASKHMAYSRARLEALEILAKLPGA